MEKLNKFKLGYFSQFDVVTSTTFIYDLLKDLQESEEMDVIAFNGGEKKEALLKSKSIGYSNKNIQLIYRLAKFSFLLKQSKEAFILKMKQKQAFAILSKHCKNNINVAFVEFATTAVLLMDYFIHHKIPFVVHVHGYDITEKMNNTAYKASVNKLFIHASKFIAASEYMKRRLILLGCDPNKITVIKIGVKDENIVPIPWSQKKLNEPSIIFLGRLTPKKCPLALIHAFKIVTEKVQNAKLSIIGDGPERKKVEALIRQLKLENSVKLYGALSREQSFPIMGKHWIYAQHSVTPISGDTEGFAISLAEAALHELPVVSTIHNGITENVKHGISGFLVPEYDYEEMALKIIELIKDPELAEKMGKNGRKIILENNQQKQRVDKIISLCQDLGTK